MKTINSASMLNGMVQTKNNIVGLAESMGPNSVKKVEVKGTSPKTLVSQMNATKKEISSIARSMEGTFEQSAGRYVDTAKAYEMSKECGLSL